MMIISWTGQMGSIGGRRPMRGRESSWTGNGWTLRRSTQIEETFSRFLKQIGMPDFPANASIVIQSSTLLPEVRTGVSVDDWDCDSAGINGNQVLFANCYALAIHSVAARNGLVLPTLLMLGDPTTAVEHDVNRAVVEAMHSLIADVAMSLDKVQIIVTESAFEDLPDQLDRIEFKLTRDKKLLSGYAGPSGAT